MQANNEQVPVVEEILHKFCHYSGTKISRQKSLVFFSNNVTQNKRMDINNRLGVVVTKELGKYLGVPIIYGRVTRSLMVILWIG